VSVGEPASVGAGLLPPQGSTHVVPAGHVFVLPPSQFAVHGVVPPQRIVQVELPAQLATQPPFGQVTVQALLPEQETVEPVSTETLQVLPPPQVTVLFVPVESVQLLVPSQVLVQLDSQVPWQVDWPAQLVVQPVPQVVAQLFFDSQEEVTPLGRVAPESGPMTPPSAPRPPKTQVPPALHVQVVPVQLQSPEQAAVVRAAPELLPLQAANSAIPPTMRTHMEKNFMQDDGARNGPPRIPRKTRLRKATRGTVRARRRSTGLPGGRQVDSPACR
jgi:hypothetical protein